MSDALTPCFSLQGVLEGSGCNFDFLGDLFRDCASHQPANNVANDDPPHASVRLLECRESTEPDGLQDCVWHVSDREQTGHLCE